MLFSSGGEKKLFVSLPEELYAALGDYGGGETELDYEADAVYAILMGYVVADESMPYLAMMGLDEDSIFELLVEEMVGQYEDAFAGSDLSEEKGSQTINGIQWKTYRTEGTVTENGEDVELKLIAFFHMDDESMVIFAFIGGLEEAASADARDALDEWYTLIPTTLRYE